VFRTIAAAMVDPNYTVAEIIAATRKSTEAENTLRMIASVDGEISPGRVSVCRRAPNGRCWPGTHLETGSGA
jgi:hypothetical protein